MYFGNVIVDNEEKDLVSFQGKNFNLITCKGSSDLKITGGRGYAESFVVSGLRKDCENLLVVAVNLHNEKRRSSGHISFILEIKCYKRQEEDRTIVKQWTPSIVDRIAAVDEYGNIEMRIDDKTFSTYPRRQDGSYYINNPDVCLNYLAGRIGVEDVMAAAKETQKQIDLQTRCDELEKINKNLSGEVASLQNLSDDYRDKLSQTIKSYKSQIEGLLTGQNRIVNSLRKDVSDWKEAATQLRDAVKSPFFKKRYGCSRMGGGFVIETRGARIKEALSLFPDFVDPRFYPDPQVPGKYV